MKNYIYKLCDINGQLLYVGKTHNFSRRIKQHLKTKAWAEHIFSVYLAECETATMMDIYELYYIGKLKPLYNKDCAHSSDESFNQELKELKFKHYFLIDYLSSSNKRIKSPHKIFEERKKNGWN